MAEFLAGIRSPKTRTKYQRLAAELFDYLELSGTFEEQCDAFAKKAKSDSQWATHSMVSFLTSLRPRYVAGEIKESTLYDYTKPIALFCFMNDIPINWKKIRKGLPKVRPYGDDRAPTLEEIRQIISTTDRRIKPIALMMVASGCRVEAFDYMDWGHLVPVKNSEGDVTVAKIRIYAGDPEEYETYITPEAYKAVEDYVRYREKAGEKVTNETPIIRDLFYPDARARWESAAASPHRLKLTGVRQVVDDALWNSGVRKKLSEGKRRHEFKSNHGFRKFRETVLLDHMDRHFVEMLQGHGEGRGTGLIRNYGRTQKETLLNHFLEAVPDLTISEEWRSRYRAANKVDKEEKSARSLVASLTTQNYNLQEQVKVLAQRLTKTESIQSDVQKKQKETDEIMNRLFQDPEFKLAVQAALRRQSVGR